MIYYMKQMIYIFKKFKKNIFFVFILEFSISGIELFNIYFISWVIKLIEEQTYMYLIYICTISLFVNFIKIYLENLQTVQHIELGKKIKQQYFPPFFKKLENIDIRKLDQIDYIIKLDKSIEAIENRVQTIIEKAIYQINLCIKFCVISFSILNLSGGIYTIILLMSLLQIAYGMIQTKSEIKFEDRRLSVFKKYNYMKEILIDKDLIIEQRILNKFDKLLNIKHNFFKNLDNILSNYSKKWCLRNSIWVIIMFFFEYIIFKLIFSLTLIGNMNISEVVFIINSQVKIVQIINTFISGLMSIGVNISYYKDYQEILENSTLIRKSSKFNPNYDDNNLITMKKVYASYFNNAYILKEITLEIKKGKKYLIIGENGCGKSTLAKVLAGILEVDKGDIYFHSKKENIAYIVQDFNKYYVRSLESIYFDRDVNDGYLEYSNIKKDRLNKILKNNKYLGVHYYKDGVDLSEGEWQKIAFIRGAVYYKDLIILDESTAKFDIFSRNKYMEKLMYGAANKTVILINHDLLMAKEVDEIILMDNGCIIGKGSHEFLLKNCYRYQQMFEKDLRSYD